MKSSAVLMVIVVGFLTLSLNAQETVWFDSNWGTSTKENATYFRPVPKKMDKGYWIIDYYLSGKKQMEGLSLSNDPTKEMYDGVVHYFYENGKKFQVVNYFDGQPEGKFYEYYDTGELKRTGKYIEALREGNWKVYYQNGKIKGKGKYNKGEKVGVWKTFYKNN